jgi:hypothetical protein
MSAISLYHQAAGTMSGIVWHTDTADRLLRILNGAVKLHIGIMRTLKAEAFAGFSIAHSIVLMHELTCPNEEGHYFFQRYSWQRSLGRIFLACYSFFRTLQWIKKLEFVNLPRFCRIIAGNLSLLKLMTDCSYILYRSFVMAESVRTGTRWKVAVSVGKIFVTAAFLVISAWKVQSAAVTLGLIILNIVLDSCILKKRIEYA